MGASPLLAIEQPHLPRSQIREIFRDLGPQEIGNGLVALIFSASGPIAVILAAAAAGNLSPDQTSSWIFGAFLGNGVLTLLLTYLYRSPQAYFWTIPGTVLAGDALVHLNFPEVVGAYLATAVLVCFLVTVSEMSLLGITAPFWGIVFGCLIAFFMDPKTKKEEPSTAPTAKPATVVATAAETAEVTVDTTDAAAPCHQPHRQPVTGARLSTAANYPPVTQHNRHKREKMKFCQHT